jgi:ubiquinone/menaquinone biosynthesis C-methylase UbiE
MELSGLKATVLIGLDYFASEAEPGEKADMSRTEGVDAAAFRGFERAAHDKIAESYHEHFSGLTNLAIAPLLAAVSIQNGSHLLEVAAGTGSLAAAAKLHGAGRVMATDLSPNMVSLAAGLHPSIEFLEADVEHLPVNDGAFDCVVCNFGLGHFPAPERAVRECVRTLRKGGSLAFSWWDKPERQRFQGLFLEAMAEAGAQAPAHIPTGPPIFRYSEDDSFNDLLTSAGLSSVSILTIGAHHRVDSVDTLWKGRTWRYGENRHCHQKPKRKSSAKDQVSLGSFG